MNSKKGYKKIAPVNFDEESEYDQLELLELLESIREDMEDVGVTTLEEVIQRIEELHKALDRQ